MLFDSGFVSSVWTAFLKTLCYNKKKGGISMLEQLRAEWKNFLATSTLLPLRNNKRWMERPPIVYPTRIQRHFMR